MPTVSVQRDQLFERLGRKYTEEELDELCFEFGIELDGVEEEPVDEFLEAGGDGAAGGGGETVTIYKFDIPANRYDLLCLEGLARALNVFLERAPAPKFTLSAPESRIRMDVRASTRGVRPYVVGAVLRGVSFTRTSYNSFIKLQEKLHFNICRRRTLVAIGTHDLDTLQPPFVYSADAPSSFSFVPLTQERAFQADELMEFYRTDPSVRHIKPYVDILDGFDKYPVIRDSKGVVLSLPPIINGEHSKMSVATKNVFIEATATDLTKVHIVLNTIVAMFSEYCEKPFEIEPVDIHYDEPEGLDFEGDGYTTPQLNSRVASATVDEINSLAGIDVTAEEAAKLASRMMLEARPVGGDAEGGDRGSIECVVPPTRADILHACDIVEDVAIAYGYNNIARKLPGTVTIGREQPVNALTDKLREEIVRDGYYESLTMGLCARDELYGKLGREDDDTAVVLGNPKSKDFEVARTSLLPGLLKSLEVNKSESFKGGLRLFEISDVIVKDPTTDTGASNIRTLAALYAGPTAGFEIIHGLVNRVFGLLEIPLQSRAEGAPLVAPGRGGFRYSIREGKDGAFFPGRCAEVLLETAADRSEQVVGVFGILHPDVLANHGITDHPGSAVELSLTPFVFQGTTVADADLIRRTARAASGGAGIEKEEGEGEEGGGGGGGGEGSGVVTA